MKIYFLLNQPYPQGYALTKRFHLYAKGFVKQGHSVKMIIPIATEVNGSLNNTYTSGIFEEVPFEYPSNSTKRSKHFLVRRYQDISGLLKTGILCCNENPDVIITSSFPFIFFLLLKVISFITSFKLVREKNEIDYMNENYISEKKVARLRRINRIFHGFIVINKQILEYLKFDLNLKTESVVVPILVEDFKQNKQLVVSKTIVYTGTYLERKDGIVTIIKAFGEICAKYPDYTLVLTGIPNKSNDFNEIQKIIRSQKIEDQIRFTGYLPAKDLHSVLISANMLILAKPENRQNKYNFPTKVGEYLISGRPVISTKVGVVGDILQHNVNVIFAEFRVSDISAKIEYIIKHPETATKIGQNGREFALTNFSYLNYILPMVEYFESLRK